MVAPVAPPGARCTRTRGVARSGPLVGVLGGGQLGRMLGLAGIPLGLAFRFLDPALPAGRRARSGRCGWRPLDDEAAAAALADGRDGGDLRVGGRARGVGARRGRARAGPARPRPRWRWPRTGSTEKTTLARLDVPVPALRAGRRPGRADRRGRPSRVAGGAQDRAGAATTGRVNGCCAAASTSTGPSTRSAGCPLILEQLVSFERELALLAVRGLDGATACYPLVETEHVGGVLRVTRAPAPGLTDARQREAESIAAPAARRPRLRRGARGRAVRAGRRASSPTSSRRGCTTRVTGRSKVR